MVLPPHRKFKQKTTLNKINVEKPNKVLIGLMRLSQWFFRKYQKEIIFQCWGAMEGSQGCFPRALSAPAFWVIRRQAQSAACLWWMPQNLFTPQDIVRVVIQGSLARTFESYVGLNPGCAICLPCDLG